METCRIKTYVEYHLPAWDSLAAEKMRLTSGEKKAPIFKASFSEEKNGIENEMVSNHHLLGRYNGIQNEYHELAFIEGTGNNDLSIEEIDQALQWKLLLQVDSDNQLDVSWGDWGRIYFFIHEKDLREFNFDKVVVSGECY